MMSQIFAIDLDLLVAHLTILEGGREVRYTIDLEPDRLNALVTREVFDEKGEAIESKSWFTSLETLGNETALPHAVMWAARGCWGIPLEFGPRASEEAVTVLSLKEVASAVTEEAKDVALPKRLPRK